ncbi:glycogenin glucosyltransferase [Coemansia erecta]|nr:glycogenin glucosyltransferase [Coemansia erecta]
MDDAGRSPNAETAAGAERFAFVTLVTSDSYVDGALVLLHSLRRTLTAHSILCLVTPSTLGDGSLQRLRQHFDGVIETDLQQSTDDRGLALLGRPDLRSTLTKIQLWHPALFGAWSAICYLDADTLVRQSVDDIFSRYSAWRDDVPEWRQGGLVAASPDTGWPDCFNSGVLLLAPGLGCYQALVRRAAQNNASFDGTELLPDRTMVLWLTPVSAQQQLLLLPAARSAHASTTLPTSARITNIQLRPDNIGADQGLLNEHFADWSTAKPYRRLPFLYNATANVYYTYEPALQRFGHDVRVVHFIGISKPWHWERTPGGQLISDSSASERWRQLVNLWWSIHDEHVSGWKHWRGPFDKSVAFGRGYQHITEPVLPEVVAPPAHEASGSGDGHIPEAHSQAHALESQVPEVSDWEKDWSWAADRVHPLDYAYLVSHTNLEPAAADSVQHSLPRQRHEHANVEHWQPNSKQLSGEQHSGDVHVRSGTNDAHYREAKAHQNDSSQNFDHRDMPVPVHHPDSVEQHRYSSPPRPDPGPPSWMQSQRPWEDVAREGWLHHEEFKPHSYDQSYIQRHINPPPPAEAHIQHHHQEQAQHWDRRHYEHNEQKHEQHWDHHQRQPEYTPLPLPQNQPIYEAAQVVLQPRHDSHGSHHNQQQHYQQQHQQHNWHEHATGHQYQDHQNSGYQGHGQQDYSHHGGGYQHSHDQQSGGYHGYSSADASAPVHHQHYVDRSHGVQVEHDYDRHDIQPQQLQAPPGRRDSQSTSSSSPLYYPQPKSPMVVNPVALWESSEEQARRRAWAQHAQAPHDSVNGTERPEHSTPWLTQAPSTDQHIPPSAMDQVDSSQLPPETPWKISHVRQRPVENTGSEASAQPTHMGMQFKEGVADDFSARDAAGQLLKRWNEAVIARNIKSKLGDIDPQQIAHSVAAPEKGTDAIRLETTVSCEAEDSKGERTVYRFTLSSTLDVGGAKAAPAVLSPAYVSDEQPQLAQSAQLARGSARNSAPDDRPAARLPILQQGPVAPSLETTTGGRMLGDADTDDRSTGANGRDYDKVTNLAQPENYHEPAMSRRSSFVQLQRNAARAPHMAMHNSYDNSDQFAESDARYWKLQRQLIDLEMSQQLHENQARDAVAAGPNASAPAGSTDTMAGRNYEKLDLASPPTPSYRQPAPRQNGPGHILQRRPSAFSVADPTTMGQASAIPSAQPVATAPTVPSSIGVGQLSRDRSRSSPHLVVDTAQPVASVPKKPSDREAITHANRSRSQSTLRRIAAENSVQAMVQSPLPQEQPKRTARPVFITSSPDASDSDSDSDVDSASKASDGETFMPASGRMPTPFPRGLRKTDTSSEQSSAASGEAGNSQLEDSVSIQRNVVDTARASPASAGFGSANFGMPVDATEGEMSPGKKLQPKINWGDDDDSLLPSDDDRSLDAQWRRIVYGAPPSRLSVTLSAADSTRSDIKQDPKPVPEKDTPSTNVTKLVPTTRAEPQSDLIVEPNGSNADTMVLAEDSSDYKVEQSFVPSPEMTVEDEQTVPEPALFDVQEQIPAVPEPTLSDIKGQAPAAPEPALSNVQKQTPAVPEPPAQPQAQKEKSPGGTRAPPRKLHSARSFLNLTSRTFDTLSDSDEDPNEAALEKRFWERAMKPARSGMSTPYSPNRRKSVTEMSSLISPRDLEEWMRWQGDSNSPLARESVDKAPAVADDEAKVPEELQQELITPPTSKSKGLPDPVLKSAEDHGLAESAGDSQVEAEHDVNLPIVLASDSSAVGVAEDSESADTPSQPAQLSVS